MARKKALIVDTSIVKVDRSKRRDTLHYQESHIRRLIDSLNVFVEDHPEAKEIQEFYNAHNIPSSTYYDLVERWPDLRVAHKTTMHKLGGRLWGRCVDFKANWNAVKFMLHAYSPEYAAAKEFDVMLAARARESINAAEGPQIVVIEKFADSPMVPERKKDEE